MAQSSDCHGSPSFSQSDRVLQASYARLWCHCPTSHKVVKERTFKWTPEAELAFQRLKQAMVSILVLALPDFNIPFVVETDAL
jgi:hypothetical protein